MLYLPIQVLPITDTVPLRKILFLVYTLYTFRESHWTIFKIFSRDFTLLYWTGFVNPIMMWKPETIRELALNRDFIAVGCGGGGGGGGGGCQVRSTSPPPPLQPFWVLNPFYISEKLSLWHYYTISETSVGEFQVSTDIPIS